MGQLGLRQLSLIKQLYAMAIEGTKFMLSVVWVFSSNNVELMISGYHSLHFQKGLVIWRSKHHA